jgi:hypothetical protein
MRAPWHFVAANVVLGPGFALAAMLPIPIAVTVRVPGRTTLALGLVGVGSSAGALVLAPAVQALVDARGWRAAYAALGAAAVATPLLLLPLLPRGRLARDSRSGASCGARASCHSSVCCSCRASSVVPVIALGILGKQRFATLYGVLQLGSTIAIGVSPVAPAPFFDRKGSCAGALVFWVVAMAAGVAVALRIPAAAGAVLAPAAPAGAAREESARTA